MSDKKNEQLSDTIKQNKKKFPIGWVVGLLILIALLACAFVPTNYYVERPGATIDLKDMITVDGKKDKEDGSFSLTSVGIYRATTLQLLRAKFTPFYDIVSSEELFQGSTSEEYNQMQLYYMQSAQNNAIQQALSLAGKDYQFEFKGVYVMGIEKTSNFYGKIAIGDTVTKADGKSFDSSEAFMAYVKGQKVGQKMTLTIIHEGKEKEVTGDLIKLAADNKPGIGISLVDHTEIESATKVVVDSGSIGGPSAGTMFTLEIYQQVSGIDLRKGRNIAGTGTINQKGEVGRIGGIDKKVASASASGATIFLAPDDEITAEMKKADPTIKTNYEEAKAAAKKLGTDMKIVPIKTLQEAIDYLQSAE